MWSASRLFRRWDRAAFSHALDSLGHRFGRAFLRRSLAEPHVDWSISLSSLDC